MSNCNIFRYVYAIRSAGFSDQARHGYINLSAYVVGNMRLTLGRFGKQNIQGVLFINLLNP